MLTTRLLNQLWQLCTVTALLFVVSNAAADPVKLTIQVVDIKQQSGNLRIALFDSEQNWLSKPKYKTIVELSSPSWTVEVPTGEYAVSLYQDVNLNGKLDTGFFGKPKEPYGMSNNAESNFGPPDWPAAKFPVLQSKTHTIQLNNE